MNYEQDIRKHRKHYEYLLLERENHLRYLNCFGCVYNNAYGTFHNCFNEDYNCYYIEKALIQLFNEELISLEFFVEKAEYLRQVYGEVCTL